MTVNIEASKRHLIDRVEQMVGRGLAQQTLKDLLINEQATLDSSAQ